MDGRARQNDRKTERRHLERSGRVQEPGAPPAHLPTSQLISRTALVLCVRTGTQTLVCWYHSCRNGIHVPTDLAPRCITLAALALTRYLIASASSPTPPVLRNLPAPQPFLLSTTPRVGLQYVGTREKLTPASGPCDATVVTSTPVWCTCILSLERSASFSVTC